MANLVDGSVSLTDQRAAQVCSRLLSNTALYTTPENVAKIGDYKHLFRLASVYNHRGARVSLYIGSDSSSEMVI